MKKTAQEPKVTDNPLYHDTWMLLRKYRDVVWSLELSVQQVRRQFQIEYGSSIEEFLESLYVAGITFEGSAIEDHARCIERSYKMLKLLDTSVELLRTKHKYGESYYWLLYSPELKFYSNRVKVDGRFRTSVEGLTCLGDSSGWTRGLMMASVHGHLAGAVLAEEG